MALPFAETRLGGLAAELRNRIYEYTLGDEDGSLAVPGILRTCRQTRQEAMGLFLSRPFTITIRDSRTRPFINWLRAKPRALASRMVKLHIVHDTTEEWEFDTPFMSANPNRVAWRSMFCALEAAGIKQKSKVEFEKRMPGEFDNDHLSIDNFDEDMRRNFLWGWE